MLQEDRRRGAPWKLEPGGFLKRAESGDMILQESVLFPEALDTLLLIMWELVSETTGSESQALSDPYQEPCIQPEAC